ncbi:tetratricopeptide repeat protein [Vibrio mexicanus]|uniref:tetratricopeptide repeat protein n=1 Tax=Vibrio mexicanus TaxID=1004326 RepID=UPI00063C787B|nr:hypothetical protein [Vibrio mexicanus]
MSEINSALSQLSKNQGRKAALEPAHVTKFKKPAWPWLLGGFAMSLAVGGWAVSQQQEEINQTVIVDENVIHSKSDSAQGIAAPIAVTSPSPTTRLAPEVSIKVAQSSVEAFEDDSVLPKPVTETIATAINTNAEHVAISMKKPQETPAPKSQASRQKEPTKKSIEEPVLLAQVSNTKAQSTVSSDAEAKSEGTVVIKQVELTPVELAEKAVIRAEKAIDGNNLKLGLSEYNNALRYNPSDEVTRQKLAALYYGQANTRKAFDLLQAGIRLDNNSEALRMALSKLLIRENQQEAALTPLLHLPPSPSRDYLSLRAALAQKSNQDEIALESYQSLVQVDSDNARWWLGLAIQEERASNPLAAQQSYQSALTKVGLSSQSQQFVRERIRILAEQQEPSSAD